MADSENSFATLRGLLPTDGGTVADDEPLALTMADVLDEFRLQGLPADEIAARLVRRTL